MAKSKIVKTPEIAEIDEAQEKLMREIDADLKNESINLWWKKYGVYVITFVVLVLFATVGFETILHWHDKGNQKWSDEYSSALEMQAIGDYTNSEKLLDEISKNGNKAYENLAKLQKVNLLLAQGKESDAIAVLEILVQDKSLNESLRNITIVKLASYKVDNSSLQEVVDLLSPLASSDSSWAGFAKEMIAASYIKANDFEKAREIYADILASKNVSSEQKNRVSDLASVISDM